MSHIEKDQKSPHNINATFLRNLYSLLYRGLRSLDRIRIISETGSAQILRQRARQLMAVGVLAGNGVQAGKKIWLALQMVKHGGGGSLKYAPQYSTRELGC